MAKFTGGYSPVTWKNVPVGNPSAFFNGAIQGGDTVFDQQRQINEREDDFRTNEALNADRLGQPRAFDRRVDQGTLQQARGYEDTLKSNLLTAGVERAGTEADTAQTLLETEQMPEELRLLQEQIKNEAASAATQQARNEILRAGEERLAAEAKRIEDLRVGTEEYDKHIEGKRRDFYQKEINDLDLANPNWRDTQASRDAGLTKAEANSDINVVQYARSGTGREILGTTQGQYAGSSIAGTLEKAGATNLEIQQGIDKGIYEAGQDTLSDFQKTKAGDTRGFQIENGLPVFGNPESQKMSGGDLRTKLSDAASRSGTTQFSTADLDSKIGGNLNDVAGSMSSSLADHIAKTVVDKHVENGGGKLSTDKFAKAFLDEAAAYRRDHFQSEIDKFEGKDIDAETLEEQYRRGVNDVAKSGDPRIDLSPPPLDAGNVDERVKTLKDTFVEADTEYEAARSNMGYLDNDRNTIKRLYEAFRKGKATPGGPDNAISMEQREAAKTEFDIIIAKHVKENNAKITAKKLDDRAKAGFK
jgi:hypothetical protein